jgi:hypothetical protein
MGIIIWVFKTIQRTSFSLFKAWHLGSGTALGGIEMNP